MKKIAALITAAVLLLVFSLCGCKSKAVTVEIMLEGDCRLDIEKAAKDYTETSGKNVQIKITNRSGAKEADAFIFDARNFGTVKNYCADMKESALAKNLYSKKVAFSADEKIYGLPLYLDYGGLLYNKNLVSGKEIKDFSALKTAVKEAQNMNASAFVYSSGSKPYYAELLLGDILFYELETNDDYYFAPYAALNAKQIALRYGDNLKDFIDIASDSAYAVSTAKEAVKEVASGKAVFCAVTGKTVDFTAVNNSIGLMPLYTGADGEEERSFTLIAEHFFAISKNAEKQKVTAAEDFFTFLIENSDAYRQNKSDVIPYKNAKNGKSEIIARVIRELSKKNSRLVISVSPAFPEGFSRTAAESIAGYLTGKTTFQAAEKEIKSAWLKRKGE